MRDSLSDSLADLAAGTGFVLPVLEWATGLSGDSPAEGDGQHLGGPAAVLPIQRRLLSTLALALEPPVSLPGAVALGRLVCAVQAGLVARAAETPSTVLPAYAGAVSHHHPGSADGGANAMALTLLPVQRERLVALLRSAAATFCPPQAAAMSEAASAEAAAVAPTSAAASAMVGCASIITAPDAELTREFRSLIAAMD